ncbi:MAG TPA: AraC family transcriptional regulator [Pyrinomonadaceae bacterium]|nr:AraC family transcriptional regulator [Pyrinomonadaceae bacterium]
MQGHTNVQRQHSNYFPPRILQPKGKKRGNSEDVIRLAPAQAPVSDLSVICPEAVVISSEPLGWQNLRAIHVRQESEWAMPPLENNCVIIQLGPAVSVTAQIDRFKFEQTVQPGDVIIVPAGSSMQWRQKDGGTNDTLHLYLHPHVVRTTAESVEFDTTQTLQPQFGIRDEQIQHIALSLLCELQDANVIGRIYADSLAQLLAMQLVRRYSERKDTHISRGGMAPGKLRKAIEFINANLDKEQTVALAAVAEEVHVSYFHFSRAFKQSTGVSPNVYMIEQRIGRAKKLLTETDLPIAEIALRVGFASQSHFTTTFRRLAWATPKSFREMA